MASLSVERWGWVEYDGIPQQETFSTAEDAIQGMARRTGNRDDALREAMRVGFRLALVRVTVTAVATLAPEPSRPAPQEGE